MHCTNTNSPKVCPEESNSPSHLSPSHPVLLPRRSNCSFFPVFPLRNGVCIYKHMHIHFLFPFSLPNDSTVRSVLQFTFATQLGNHSSPARGELPLSPSQLQKFHGLDVPSHFTGASWWVFRLVPAIYYHHKAAMPVLMQTSFCKDAYVQNKLLEVEPVGIADVCL